MQNNLSHSYLVDISEGSQYDWVHTGGVDEWHFSQRLGLRFLFTGDSERIETELSLKFISRLSYHFLPLETALYLKARFVTNNIDLL